MAGRAAGNICCRSTGGASIAIIQSPWPFPACVLRPCNRHTQYESSTGQLLSSWDTGGYFGPGGECNHGGDVNHTAPCPAFIAALHNVDSIHVVGEQQQDLACHSIFHWCWVACIGENFQLMCCTPHCVLLFHPRCTS